MQKQEGNISPYIFKSPICYATLTDSVTTFKKKLNYLLAVYVALTVFYH